MSCFQVSGTKRPHRFMASILLTNDRNSDYFVPTPESLSMRKYENESNRSSKDSEAIVGFRHDCIRTDRLLIRIANVC